MWKWIKKNWLALLAVFSSIAAFVAGRQSIHRSIRSADDARRELDELREELGSARARISQLVRDNRNLTERLRELDVRLEEARKTVDIARQYHSEAGTDLRYVRAISRATRTLIEKYRAELEKIPVD